MSISAFGVDHGDIFGKAASFVESKEAKDKRVKETPSEAKTKKDKEYRSSVYQKVNRRSNTYVKRGTMPERIARPLGSSIGLSFATGGVTGPGAPIAGGTWGRTRNLQTGDTRAYHMKSKKPARSYIGNPDVGGYYYDNKGT